MANDKEPLLQFFFWKSLPEQPFNLREVNRPFCELAVQLCEMLPSNPDRTAALRALLEAKECAVRALTY